MLFNVFSKSSKLQSKRTQRKVTKKCVNKRSSSVLIGQYSTKGSEYNKITEILNSKLSSKDAVKMEETYAAHNYHPLPIVFTQAKGVRVKDPEGNQYLDFVSAYSALNQGHCNENVLATLIEQSKKLHLTSRAFYNDVFPKFAKYVTELLGYDMILPMNTGAEAVETAIKLSRRWGYDKKGIPDGEAIILCCSGNFHGRTIGAISLSDDPESYGGYSPLLPGIKRVTYNDVGSLKSALEEHGKKVCGFIVEPIQGEAGVMIPKEGYLKECYDLCKQHNVLMIADEIQSGFGRTGKMMCYEWSNIKPDIVIVGKALSGGVYPASAVFSNKEVMLTIKPGQHGSTYGGNPLASAVSMAALSELVDGKLPERAGELGGKLLKALKPFEKNMDWIKEIRGKGLWLAIEVVKGNSMISAWGLCLLLKREGLLAKPTHDNIIRLSPPLTISESEIDEAIGTITGVLERIPKMSDAEKKKLMDDLDSH